VSLATTTSLTHSWYANWTEHLPGQTGLGHSGGDGVYYSVSYKNTLFVVRDSDHVSGTATSYADAQTQDLASVLGGSTAQFKFLFYHQPTYSCSTYHEGNAALLPWLDLAERNNVDVVFNGHTHVYTRRCRAKGATCTNDNTGTVQVETGTVGGMLRELDVPGATVTGTDSTGTTRADTYSCTTNVLASRGSVNDFCYVQISACRATISCYVVGSGNTTPFDTWQIDHC